MVQSDATSVSTMPGRPSGPRQREDRLRLHRWQGEQRGHLHDELRRLETDSSDGHPWQRPLAAYVVPNGTRIAFTSDGTDGIGEIYVMNADGSGLTQLTDDPADDAFPAWRP